jgi:hypothetical protein
MIENENINVGVRRQEWLMPSFVVVLYALLQAKFFISMMNLKSFGLEQQAFVVFNVIFFWYLCFLDYCLDNPFSGMPLDSVAF